MIIGYKLLDGGGEVLRSWGGIRGQEPAAPKAITLSNGDRVHCPDLDTDLGGGIKLVPWDDADLPVTSIEVNAERDRRIGEPITVLIEDIGPVRIDMTPQSRNNIQGLITLAMLQQGSTEPMVTFRDADNEDHDLTPAQVIQMAVQAAQRVDAIYKASWALKAEDPIPIDYTAGGHWGESEPESGPGEGEDENNNPELWE